MDCLQSIKVPIKYVPFVGKLLVLCLFFLFKHLLHTMEKEKEKLIER